MYEEEKDHRVDHVQQVILRLGDCVDIMRNTAPNSVDAVISDPPYG